MYMRACLLSACVSASVRASVHVCNSYLSNSYQLAILGLYFTGDGALRDSDGHYRITGRMDDVINVSGKRLGTAEIEDAMVTRTFFIQ